MDNKELIKRITLHLRECAPQYAELIAENIQSGMIPNLPLKFYDLLNKEFEVIFLKPGTVLRIYDDTFLKQHRKAVVLNNQQLALPDEINFEDRVQCPNPYCLNQGQVEIEIDGKLTFYCLVCNVHWKWEVEPLKEETQ